MNTAILGSTAHTVTIEVVSGGDPSPRTRTLAEEIGAWLDAHEDP